MNAPEIGTAVASADTVERAPANDIYRVLTPQFIRMVRRLYACGPRAVAELLLEVADHDDLALRLPVYAALDPKMVAALGARDFPDSPLIEVRDDPSPTSRRGLSDADGEAA